MRIVAHIRESESFLFDLPLEGSGSARLVASFSPGSEAMLAELFGEKADGNGGNLVLDVKNAKPVKQTLKCWFSLEGTPEAIMAPVEPPKTPEAPALEPQDDEEEDDVSMWTKTECKTWLADHGFEVHNARVSDLRNTVLEAKEQEATEQPPEVASEPSEALKEPEALHPAPVPEEATGAAYLFYLDATISSPGRELETFRSYIHGSTVDPATGHHYVSLRFRSRKTGRDLK